jgi:hypothetical protein
MISRRAGCGARLCSSDGRPALGLIRWNESRFEDDHIAEAAPVDLIPVAPRGAQECCRRIEQRVGADQAELVMKLAAPVWPLIETEDTGPVQLASANDVRSRIPRRRPEELRSVPALIPPAGEVGQDRESILAGQSRIRGSRPERIHTRYVGQRAAVRSRGAPAAGGDRRDVQGTTKESRPPEGEAALGAGEEVPVIGAVQPWATRTALQKTDVATSDDSGSRSGHASACRGFRSGTSGDKRNENADRKKADGKRRPRRKHADRISRVLVRVRA